MLTKEEIKKFLIEDEASFLKKEAKEGQDYYEAQHDILNYRMFYWNAEGLLVEDTVRSNVKIPSGLRRQTPEQLHGASTRTRSKFIL